MKVKLLAIAFGLALGLVVIELFSLGYFALTQGGLFYSAQRTAPSVDGPEAAPGEEAQQRLHPYFGFVRVETPTRDVNNHGFAAAPFDYPFVKQNEDQVLIGVFGGSVAAGFVRAGQEHLVQRLQQHPAFKGKEIVLLSFAQGGFKQPQQLLALSYYLTIGQELDMVINLDGFNEVALSSRNNAFGMDISMPSSDHLMPLVNLIDQSTLSDERIEALAGIKRSTAQLERINARAANARLASTWFLWQQLYRIQSASLGRKQVAFQELTTGDLSNSMMAIYPPMQDLAGDDLYQQIATEWADASILMHTLLQSRGIPYYHFLQPNQYFSQKPFSPEEQRTALTEGHPYRTGAELGYPALLAQEQRLVDNGVAFHSAVTIFDNEPRTLYNDDCCHFNTLGNEILADFIADVILTVENQ